MARLPKYECDRCGARYDKNHAKDVYGHLEHNLIGLSLVNTDRHLLRFDLCDDCLKDVQEWLKNPQKESTDEDGVDE